MKLICQVMLLTILFTLPVGAQFNPTPHPLEHDEKSECGVWVSLNGNYRLMITPISGSCDGVQTQLQVTLFRLRQPLAHGVVNSSNKSEFCGSLKTRGPKNIDLCLWIKNENLYSNVRKDSPWQPFEIFSKETYY